MASPFLKLALLFTISLSCASVLEPWHQTWAGGRNQSANILDMLVGDSRRMFANHFFAKADAYFHSGYYPTIFDPQDREEESHLTGGNEDESTAHHVHDANCHHEDEPQGEHHEHDANCEHAEEADAGFLGAPKDWIDRFSRNFFPAQHSHLEQGGERELLPWLRLSSQLDPQRVDTYTIASYWLRSRLGKVDEAEQFLREGLRSNPDSYEIYYELGRIYDEDRKTPQMARNLWEIALRKWNVWFQATQTNDKLPKPNDLVYEGIVGRLARLEEAAGNLQKAIYYLQLLKEKSPVPDVIQKQIQELQQKLDEQK